MKSLSQERTAFERCVMLAGAERESALAEVCGDDAEFRARILRLLAAHDSAARYETTGFVAKAGDELAPKRIGPYELVEQVGVGGMGEVWTGEQSAPVKRKVAIKLIKAGMDTRDVLARFEVERQALALMNHPSIARIFDAGSTDNGRPYFVMEFVEGVPITQWCDEQRLDLDSRIRLFGEVCAAVQHAHQKGVIHRDLKPSNILVALADGHTRVKVIDFGIAKASDETIPSILATPATRIGDMLGTPDYMSPEQAGAVALDLDTRADVYALGAVLYELICGCRPLALPPARSDLAELRRVIRDVMPTPPSQRFREVGNEERAAHFRASPAAMRDQVRGELDWITLKALEKDRDRRYQTVSALGDDLARYLTDEAIEARPPDLRYRLGKYLRRHRGLVIGVTAVLAAIAITAGGFAVRLAEQRDLAITEAQRAEKMAEFLSEMIYTTSVDSERWAGADIDSIRKLLTASIPKIDTQFGTDPLLRARLYGTIGQALTSYHDQRQNDVETGRDLLQKAIALRRPIEGANDAQVMSWESLIGRGYYYKGDNARAIAIQEGLIARIRAGQGRDELLHGQVALELGNLYQIEKRFDDAYRTLQEAQAAFARDPASTFGNHTAVLGVMATVLTGQGRLEESIRVRRQAIEILRANVPPTSPRLLMQLGNLAVALPKDHPEREKLLEEVIASKVATLGPDTESLIVNYYSLSNTQRAIDKYAESLRSAIEAVRIASMAWGADHPRWPHVKLNLALALLGENRAFEAREPAEDAWRALTARANADPKDVASADFALGSVRMEERRYQEAEKLLLSAASIAQPKDGASMPRVEHRFYAEICNRLSALYERQGKTAQSEVWKARASAPSR